MDDYVALPKSMIVSLCTCIPSLLRASMSEVRELTSWSAYALLDDPFSSVPAIWSPASANSMMDSVSLCLGFRE
jgi:hypothetical protein